MTETENERALEVFGDKENWESIVVLRPKKRKKGKKEQTLSAQLMGGREDSLTMNEAMNLVDNDEDDFR